MGYLTNCRTGSAIGTCESCKNTAPPQQQHRRLRIFKLKELERATDSFSTSNILGKGSHACVYKGVLDDGQVVAVKRPTIGRRTLHDVAAFDNELDVLSSLQCRHLVNLIGYCNESSEKLLVVEFMGNGTLFDLLHSRTEPLSWTLRVHMALQAAKAILALHSASPPIIHRDVKSSNVLVDSNWNAKLGDLGLAVRGQWEDVVRQRAPPAGTMGYIDPQYETPSQLSSKSDVFSFGILLLEIMSGRNAIDVRFSPSSIVDWAVPLIKQGNSFAVCDPALKGSQNPIVVKHLAAIAARSVRSSRDRRPTMAEIVQGLREIRRKVASFRFGPNPLRSSLSSTLVKRVRSSRELDESVCSRLSQSSSIHSDDSSMVGRDDTISPRLSLTSDDSSHELFTRRSRRLDSSNIHGDLPSRKLSSAATARLNSRKTESLLASSDMKSDMACGASGLQILSSFSSDISFGDISGRSSSWRSFDSPSRKFLDNISRRSAETQSWRPLESPVFGSKRLGRVTSSRTCASPSRCFERSVSLGTISNSEILSNWRRESFKASGDVIQESNLKSFLAKTRSYSTARETQISCVSKAGEDRIVVRSTETFDGESRNGSLGRFNLPSFSLQRMSYCRASIPTLSKGKQDGSRQQMQAKECREQNSNQIKTSLPVFLAAVEDIQDGAQRGGYQD